MQKMELKTKIRNIVDKKTTKISKLENQFKISKL